MMTAAAILVALFGLAAALGARRYPRLLLGLGLGALLIAGLGFTLPSVLPADFFVRHPQLTDSPLHPWRSALYGAIALALGSGILLGLLCRSVFNLKRDQNDRSRDTRTADRRSVGDGS